nr:uncharacterized protein LOC126055082 [Helicoverpa armigera]
MDYKNILFGIFALISLNDAVKVNMQGAVSIGKEVMDTISHYMQKNTIASGRRSMTFSKENDVLYLIIKSTYLCRDLDFCDGNLEQFLNEYIMVQTKSIEAIFEGILSQKDLGNEETQLVKRLIFEEELKKCLREIRKLLRSINMKVSSSNDPYMWSELIKKISIMFQTAAIEFASHRLEGSPKDINEVKKKLKQKFVIATAIVEGKYESKLCSEYDICIKAYECTKALDTLLGSFKDMEEDNVKIFIRYVSEALMETKFYSHVSDVTANEMQIILNDMAYSDNVPTKEVLLTIHRTVEDRLNSLITKKHMINGRDVELVHAILSDMDHIYGKHNVDPFHNFMTSYFEWSRTGSRLGTPVRTLLKEISDELSEVEADLSLKLINEVRAFLEITVDPEK